MGTVKVEVVEGVNEIGIEFAYLIDGSFYSFGESWHDKLSAKSFADKSMGYLEYGEKTVKELKLDKSRIIHTYHIEVDS